MKLLTHYLNEQRKMHPEIVNWRENYINDSLFYSWRSTEYERDTYPTQLHYHDYYELVMFVQGDVRYLCEGQLYRPQPGDILLVPPKTLHMSMLDAPRTLYQRHVFYLYPDALDSLNCQVLTGFLSRQEGRQYLTTPDARSCEMLFSLLPLLDQALDAPFHPEEMALALGYVIQIFYLLNRATLQEGRSEAYLPQNLADIQRYLDLHFTEIESVAQVAAHFYYSREYLSRLFRQHFHTTVADYILKQRIAYSQSLIAEGKPLLEVCFQSGFKNVSTFIRSFRSVVHMTPSRYRALLMQPPGNLSETDDNGAGN